MAHCEVYILNYNGEAFLTSCLRSLERIDLNGGHSLGVNVVDNGSTDNSKQLVAEGFPDVNFIELGFNHGFSKGNNLGVKYKRSALKREGRRADYHVFLNNDTVVEPKWLLEALRAFGRSPDVGIVGSKSLFFDKFVVLGLEAEHGFRPSDFGSSDSRTLGFFIQGDYGGKNVFIDPRRSKLPEAFSPEEDGRWVPPKSRLFVAVGDPSKRAEFCFMVGNRNPHRDSDLLRVVLNGTRETLGEYVIKRGETRKVAFNFERNDYVDVVQNAGSYVNRDWTAGDRGFLEIDRGQFDEGGDVDAVCGVSLFIKDSLWKRLRGFDEHYFAYYEDTDLSLRARLLGYRCVYAPGSVLRHVHCGSAVEYSDYFNNNVTYSHMIFSSKMMNRRDWQDKKRTCFERAKEEFSAFVKDFSLEKKPNLRAYCRYLKHRPFFAANRLYSAMRRPGKYLHS